MSHRTIPVNNTIELDQTTEAESFDTTRRWPSLDEFVEYGKQSGIPPDDAQSIWQSYTAVGWIDKHGNPIRHWGAALKAAWQYRQSSSNKNHDNVTNRVSSQNKDSKSSSRELRIAQTLAYMEQQEQAVH